ncbi:hypothetical protein Hanom_Chr17g01531851 [Helianthus anomalus]
MGWFKNVTTSKRLFLTLCAVVLIGMIFSAVYVFSAVYSHDFAFSWNLSPCISHPFAVYIYMFYCCNSVVRVHGAHAVTQVAVRVHRRHPIFTARGWFGSVSSHRLRERRERERVIGC